MKMRHTVIHATAIAFALAAFPVLAQETTTETTTTTTVKKHNYVYYGDHDIYFAPETKRQILQNVRKVMAPGAALFLGAAETTIGLDSAFERERAGSSVFYRMK